MDLNIEMPRKVGRPRKIKKDTDKSKKELCDEYNKNYYIVNKEKMLSKLSSKITCSNCNSTISKSSLSFHKKTMKCKSHGINICQLIENKKRQEDLNLYIETVNKMDISEEEKLFKIATYEILDIMVSSTIKQEEKDNMIDTYLEHFKILDDK
jgi:hypothetical protein